MRATAKRRPVFASDILKLGGRVRVVEAHDRTDGSDFFRISYISAGGDIAWQSPPLHDPDIADASARTLAAFVNGEKV